MIDQPPPDREFNQDNLLAILQSYPRPAAYVVGYSGGLDSAVLLHATAALRARLQVDLRVLHVNHSLNVQAPEWARFCALSCETLGVGFEQITVDARPPAGESPEDWARRLRYQVFAEHLTRREILLTAHHRDDQAETLLLQLLRGAGPHGLAAMPVWRPFQRGFLLRPLLGYARKALQAYADAQGLRWVDDGSNSEVRFDRNFIRHEVLPQLQRRWPRCAETLTRAAGWQAEAAGLIDTLAATDLATVTGAGATLSVHKLLGLPAVRRRAALRLWFRQRQLATPNAVHLQALENEVLLARWDSVPLLRWADVEVRRYRDGLFAWRRTTAMRSLRPQAWNLDAQQELALDHGRIFAQQVAAGGLGSRHCVPGRVSIRYRCGGEAGTPQGSRHRLRLKELFQKFGVAPWLRDEWPLIFIDEYLAAVPNLCVFAPFAQTDEPGWQILWQPDSG